MSHSESIVNAFVWLQTNIECFLQHDLNCWNMCLDLTSRICRNTWHSAIKVERSGQSYILPRKTPGIQLKQIFVQMTSETPTNLFLFLIYLSACPTKPKFIANPTSTINHSYPFKPCMLQSYFFSLLLTIVHNNLIHTENHTFQKCMQ
jgi:hypothetical protein